MTLEAGGDSPFLRNHELEMLAIPPKLTADDFARIRRLYAVPRQNTNPEELTPGEQLASAYTRLESILTSEGDVHCDTVLTWTGAHTDKGISWFASIKFVDDPHVLDLYRALQAPHSEIEIGVARAKKKPLGIVALLGATIMGVPRHRHHASEELAFQQRYTDTLHAWLEYIEASSIPLPSPIGDVIDLGSDLPECIKHKDTSILGEEFFKDIVHQAHGPFGGTPYQCTNIYSLIMKQLEAAHNPQQAWREHIRSDATCLSDIRAKLQDTRKRCHTARQRAELVPGDYEEEVRQLEEAERSYLTEQQSKARAIVVRLAKSHIRKKACEWFASSWQYNVHKRTPKQQQHINDVLLELGPYIDTCDQLEDADNYYDAVRSLLHNAKTAINLIENTQPVQDNDYPFSNIEAAFTARCTDLLHELELRPPSMKLGDDPTRNPTDLR